VLVVVCVPIVTLANSGLVKTVTGTPTGSAGTPSTTISAPGTRSVNEREMEMALADPTQVKLSARTTTGRSNRGLICRRLLQRK
jgi:hypothetical protein